MLFCLKSLNVVTPTLLLFFCCSAIAAPLGFLAKDRDAVAQTNQKPDEEIRRLETLSQQQYFQGKYEAAIQTLKKVVPLKKKFSYYSPYQEAEALNTIGFIYFIKGGLAKSSEYIKRVLDFGKKLNSNTNKYGVSERTLFEDYVLRHITRGGGTISFFYDYSSSASFNRNEELTKTIEYMKDMLAMSRKLSYRIDEGILLIGLGNAYASGFYPTRLGDIAASVDYYKQSIAVASLLKNKDKAASIMSRCANANEGDVQTRIYDIYGRVQLACGQLALRLYREIKNFQKEYEVLQHLAYITLAIKDYKQANIYLKQLLVQNNFSRKNSYDPMSQDWVLSKLGVSSVAIGKFDEAVKYYQMLSQIKAGSLEWRKSIGYQGLGNVYYLQGNYAKAIEYYRSALNSQIEFLGSQAESRLLQPMQAHKAVELDLASALLDNGYFPEAKALINKVLKLSSDPPAFVDDGTGAVGFSGNPNFAEQVRPYNLLQGILIQQGHFSEALEIAERGRSRSTKILIANRLSNSPQNIRDLNINNESLTFNNQQIQKVVQEQQSTLVNYSIVYDDKSIIRQNPQVAELFIWVVKPTGEIVFRRSDFKGFQQQNIGLQELVASSRKAVITRGSNKSNNLSLSVGNFVKLKDDLPNWQPWKVIASNSVKHTLTLTHPTFDAGVTIERPIADVLTQTTDARSKDPQLQQLYQLLIAPIADQLPTDPNAQVVFIPQGELALVPFPALQQPDGTYLIEKHTVLTSPSIQVLDLTHQQLNRLQKAGLSNSLVVGVPRNTVVVGNPTMPQISSEIGEAPQSLRPLPGAEQEAKAVAQLLNTQALTGGKATKTAVLQQISQAQIIHLATHGIFDDRNGLNSAVALAPSGKDDGFLTANEILNLKLNAQLVVLSACDTGRGKITGDGVIGLSRSLISAGVPSVIVSLWAIPDAPTAELMTDFYRNLQKGQNKAQALRQAMLSTMKNHPAPKDWAAFTLIGEAE